MATPPERPKGLLYLFQELDYDLRYRGRFSLPPRSAELVRQFVSHHVQHASRNIEEGTPYFRARINGLGMYDPYPKQEMGPPPYGHAFQGRVNPEGIPYLYLADSEGTAISEVRPWKGALVSVGKFRVKQTLRVVDLSYTEPVGSPKGLSDEEKEWFTGAFRGNIIKTLYFSTPAHGQDRLGYLASQYIAEMIRNAGVDGLLYKSILNEPGTNLALFNPEVAECQEVKTFRVSKIQVEYGPQ